MKDPRAQLLSRHLPSGSSIEEELALLAAQTAEKQRIVEDRLQVIDAYLQIDAPTADAADAAAAQIGIARRRFYRLLANLREFGPVRALTPGFRKIERSAPTKDGLSEVAEGAISHALARDPDAKLASIEQFVRAACESKNLHAPNKTAIRRRVLAIRRSGANFKSQEPLGARVVIDQIVIDLPVAFFDKVTLSVVTLIIDRATRLILGSSIHAGDAWGMSLRSALADSQKRIPNFEDCKLLVAEHLQELTWVVPPGLEYAATAISPDNFPDSPRPTINVEAIGARRHGDAILRLIGDRLGVYNLRQSLEFGEDPPRSDQFGMHIEDASRVASYLVDRWNERILSTAKISEMSHTNKIRHLKQLSNDIEMLFKPVLDMVEDRRKKALRAHSMGE